MILLPVVSSNVDSVGHDKERNVLRVKYKSGGTYDHFGIDANRYAELMRAPSIGKNLHAHIKPAATRIEKI